MKAKAEVSSSGASLSAPVGCYWGNETLDPKARSSVVSVEETMAYYQQQAFQAKSRSTQELSSSVFKPKPYKGTKLEIRTDAPLGRQDIVAERLPTSDMDAHQSILSILHVLIESIRRQLGSKLSNKEMFQPPKTQLATAYYTPVVEKEHIDYFSKQRQKQENEDNQGIRQRWLRQLHVTKTDDQRYTFDRSTTFPLDFSKRRPREKTAKSSKVPGFFSSRSDWSSLQSQHFEHQSKRFEHLIAVLQEQQEKEIQREHRALGISIKQAKHATAQHLRDLAAIAKERAEVADWIFRILEEYKLVSNMELTAYLKQTLASLYITTGSNAGRMQPSHPLAMSSVASTATTSFKSRRQKKSTTKASNPPKYIESDIKSYAAAEALWSLQQEANAGRIHTASTPLLCSIIEPKTGHYNRSYSSLLHSQVAYYDPTPQTVSKTKSRLTRRARE